MIVEFRDGTVDEQCHISFFFVCLFFFFFFFAFREVEYDRIYEGKFFGFYFVSLLECIKCVA